MQVDFQRTGGAFGPPQRRSWTVDTADLAPEEALEMMRLVRSALIRKASKDAAPPRDLPRRYQYAITVEQDGQKHRVRISEVDLSDALRALVNWLSQRATHSG